MANTPRGYPIFTGTMPPAGPTQMQQMAEAIDADVGGLASRIVPAVFTAGTTAAATYTGSALLLSLTIPAAPYARLLDVAGQIYGGAITGGWQGALSVAAGAVDAAQRMGAFPSSGEGQVALSMTYELPADTATTVRLWYRRGSASGSITNIATGGTTAFLAGAFTSLRVLAWRR